MISRLLAVSSSAEATLSDIDVQIEVAIRLISQYMGSAAVLGKPTLFHSIRVGVSLYSTASAPEVVLAGFLHDILEDTSCTADQIESLFGAEVRRLVEANTKDRAIADATTRREELIRRCVANGDNACLVKAADILDNLGYYRGRMHSKGIQYAESLGRLLLSLMETPLKHPLLTCLENELKLS